MYNFDGFSPESLQFLYENQQRNDKPWFEENRDNYNRYLLEPFRALVTELAGPILSIDPEFETRPLINKTISKIFRDTRFSKNKNLFRAAMWLSFKRHGMKWQQWPGYFFELTPEHYRYGMGFYMAKRDTMDLFRQKINENPEEFQAATAFLHQSATFRLEGENYKRPLPGNHPPDIQEWYQKKSFYLVATHEPGDTLFTANLIKQIWEDIHQTESLYRFLCESIS